MNRRNLFKMFGGALAAAALPLGALARPRFAPLTRHNVGVEVRFTDEMLTWEEFMANDSIQRISERIDREAYRSLK
jgi:hypothetical protein